MLASRMVEVALPTQPASCTLKPGSAGRLIINADDWGRDRHTTQCILECARSGGVSSTSAMVFMEDSGRAAEVARECGIDAGLHLNFTTPFSAAECPARLRDHQERIARFLRRSRIAQAIFHPGLAGSFQYVVAAQIEEFRRLYHASPARIDGHHHMHLCANVILGRLLPAGVIVRRGFSRPAGTRGGLRQLYRTSVDRMLARRHRLTDYFFSLAPLEPVKRLEQIRELSTRFVVELATHPVNSGEYQFLCSDTSYRRAIGLEPVRGFVLPDLTSNTF